MHNLNQSLSGLFRSLPEESIRPGRTRHPEAGLHDLRILRGDGVPVVSFDAVLPYSVEMSDERIVEELSTFVTENTAGYRSDIRVDRK